MDWLEAEDEYRNGELLDRIFDAVAAAADGHPTAAKWALSQMTRYQYYAGQVKATRSINALRPSDYWDYS